MKSSLGARLLLVASLVMAAFFGITGFVLDTAYSERAESALHDRLQVYAYSLIAASEPAADGSVVIAHPVSEVRFFLPGSGLYARIVRNDGRHIWDSPSVNGKQISFPVGLARAVHRFDTVTLSDATTARAFSVGVAWEGDIPLNEVFTVSVAEDVAAFTEQTMGFRRTLWGWLGVMAIVLLAVQWRVLRWGLAPLRRAAADLLAIEAGTKSRLDENYPRELLGLTTNLNALVHNEREQRERSRRALGDLAHSLKTPLAILRGAAEAEGSVEEFSDTVQTQVGRMSEIVDYQLRRAATTGRSVLKAAAPVAEVVHKVVDALNKARADKNVECQVSVAAGARFHGDREDLMEILGNLLDNAYKWCRHRVRIEVRAIKAGGGAEGIEIAIEDDGPGVSDAITARTQENHGGHGIGLAIVRDIVGVYGGRVAIARGAWGGARVVVEI